MAYFAMQYQVLFHDTMAYGSHHHMANLKFQNVARETLLFESKVNGHGGWYEQMKDIVVLTREAYSFNMAPVGLGEKVGILLSYEEPTRSTVRLCFRVMNDEGRPVSCGYQTLIMLDKDTQHLVPAPTLLTQYLNPARGYSLVEALMDPSFAERVHGGSMAVKDLFPDDICALGRHVASAPRQEAYPKIINTAFSEYPLHTEQ